MPINKQTKTDSGVPVSYHKVVKLEVDLRSDTTIAWVYSWADEAAATAGLPHAFAWTHPLPADALNGEGTVVDKLEAGLVSASETFKDGELISDKTLDLNSIKLRKNAEINRARLAANRSTFTFSGRVIACDELSQLDIASTNGEISLTQALPDNWPMGWKTMDNSFVSIPDVATWVLFYKAMVAQGTANFKKAQDLKAALAAATTAAEVDAIKW